MSSARVKTGLDVLADETFRRLRGLRVGLLVHQASVDANLVHATTRLRDAGIEVAVLFGPEHGLSSAAQDMEAVGRESSVDRLRIYSLYGDDDASLHPTAEMLTGLDVVVVDLQDVDARYYTYAATMGFVMEAAARLGVRVMVLDRPNPLGGRDEDIEGPCIAPSHHSFVGAYDMAIRHGLTIGEYARFVLGLTVVAVAAWVLYGLVATPSQLFTIEYRPAEY